MLSLDQIVLLFEWFWLQNGRGVGYSVQIPKVMVLILDGNSEIGAHVGWNICYLIWLRHLIRSRAVRNRIFFLKKDQFPELSYHLIYKHHAKSKLLFNTKFCSVKCHDMLPRTLLNTRKRWLCDKKIFIVPFILKTIQLVVYFLNRLRIWKSISP